ncbi:MAG: elongation factor Ts [Deltaproteobacteria bacterium]|nr:elongation factor Ts [Deltaproteobacteria bacterium]
MTITAGMVKDLREKTGVGMMECKKALTETNGDMDKAIVWLREHGMARAQKKEGRVAAEGVVEVFVNPEQNAGVLVELNCETDFVSKNEEFRALAHDIAKLAFQHKAKDHEELLGLKLGAQTVKDKLTELIAKIGENMQVRRVKVVHTATGVVTGYSHMGGRIGTLVVLEGAKGDDVVELGKDLAMHVAAASPRYLVETEVNASELDQEREIARKRLEEEGKPAELIEKILVGQMKKFYKEVCLIEQAYVKDPNVTVQKHVDSLKKGLKIAGFARFQLGEGIEKKKEDFAAEVAAQLKK